ncbi:hypothetical protein C1I97_23585 [Streptomyces sp. NTH33]|uniref:DUF6338 family protein n=1 Tax=Streptomyces sp. NTH33 TaxID=1735453 RepID=UPI000DA740D5|nr:DUF6338 family protein [Streptomyces sp. NTH33]PZH00013.1 hypothetical protein C1I97_23585 [Streptomyces sp. NTH33]
MPTNVASLVLLVALALPGYVYYRAVDRHVPERVHTAFQELMSILFVSVTIDVGVLTLLMCGSSLGLWYGPDFPALLDKPTRYVTRNFPDMALWSLTALLIAVAFAYVLGCRWWARRLPGSWTSRWQERSRRLEPQKSAWWLIFREHPDAAVHLGCVLEDGSYLAGQLHSFSRSPVENGDRELTLSGDISYRAPGDSTAAVLPHVNAVVISARQLVFVTVSYLPAESDPDPGAGQPGDASLPAGAAGAAAGGDE